MRPRVAGVEGGADSQAVAGGQWSIRAYLIALVLACVLPGIVGTGLLILLEYRSSRAQLEQGTIAVARALVQAVDSRLLRAKEIAETLALSPTLARQDLRQFHLFLQQAISAGQVGTVVVLSDRSGQQVLNTLREYEAPLPAHGNPEILRAVLESAKPVISDIYIGGVLRRSVMSVDVPVLTDGATTHVLSVGLAPSVFNEILLSQRLPNGWVAAIFDSGGTIAGRTHLAEEFAGQKGTAEFISRIRGAREGSMNTVTREGIATHSVWSRSPLTGWSVGIGIPRRDLEEDFQQSILMLGAGAVLLLALGLGLAWIVGTRIAHSVTALSAPANALGTGEASPMPFLHVTETARVASAIDRASKLLASRTAALNSTISDLEHKTVTLQRFVYTLSHDLREPLNTIINFSGLLGDAASGPDERRRKYVEYVRAGASRMKSLLDDLLRYVRLDTPRLVAEDCDLGKLVREVIDDLGSQISQTGALVEQGPLPTMRCDPALIRVLFQNLISNGIKFARPGVRSMIGISAAYRAESLCIEVRDNGIGIAADHLPGIFDPFSRMNLRDQYPGSGLGLAICKKVAEMHGGEMRVESEPGRGSCFALVLPRGEIEGAA